MKKYNIEVKIMDAKGRLLFRVKKHNNVEKGMTMTCDFVKNKLGVDIIAKMENESNIGRKGSNNKNKR